MTHKLLSLEQIVDFQTMFHGRPDLPLVEELCRGYLSYLDMVPRPISEAPRDGTEIWTPDKGGTVLRRTVFVSAEQTASEIGGKASEYSDVWGDPDFHADNWEPKWFIASLPAIPKGET